MKGGFLEAGADAVVIADTGGIVVLVNGPAEGLFGFGRAELVGRPLEILVPVRFRDQLAMGCAMQLFGLRRDGTEIPIEITLGPLETDDGPLVSATIRDIRERLKFEASFETLYREAQEARRRRDELLATLPPSQRPVATFGRPVELTDLRVLVLVDEDDARAMVVEILQRCGALAIGVASSAAALNVLETRLPDVIVSDVRMPVEDGYTFMRKVRSRPAEQGGKIPAAALTAFIDAEERARALGAGFQVQVAKPIDPEKLVLTVANLARMARA